jgi:hypothetical protein
MGEDFMESPRRPRVWYFFSEDLPDGEILVPIKCEYGMAFAVRPGLMAPEMLNRLNENVDHLMGVGLARLDIESDDMPSERKE